MKAVELQNSFGIESLALTDRPRPEPGPGEVRVRMRAYSLNYRDLLMVKGLYNPKLKLPIVPLSDGMGVVDTVGAGVSRWKPGDRVAGCFMQQWGDGPLTDAAARSALGGALDGVLAEEVVFREDGLVAVPAHLTDEQAATLPCAALTAWHALMTDPPLLPGQTVLIQGTGGVSLFALQFARLAGARVIATSSSDEKLERVKALGASDGINYRTTPEWGDRVRELTGGGVDHVVEVGGAGTMPQSLRAVKTGGHIALIGILSGGSGFNPVPILMKGVRVQGIFVGSRRMFEEMNRAVALHRLAPVVDRVFAYTEVRAALQHMESGSHFGKICLKAS